MSSYPWPVFFVLLGAGFVGVIAIIPYAFALTRDRIEKAPVPPRTLAILQIVQGTILQAVVIGLGLLMAEKIGLGAPVLKAALAGESVSLDVVVLAIGGGLLAGLLITGADILLRPYVPKTLQISGPKIAMWKRALTPLYGGIVEENLMRLFLMTLIVWLTGYVWETADGLPADGAFWVGIIGAAVVFGLGHLPATKSLAPLTPMVIVRALLLNGIGGIIFGLLYWQHGLESAMVAHAITDIVLHVMTPLLARGESDNTPASAPALQA
jgi:hypothetical protein